MTYTQPQVFLCVPCEARREFREPSTNPNWWPRCESCGKPMVAGTPTGKVRKVRPPFRKAPPQIPGQMSLLDES